MSSTGAGYDLSATTYSPDGRLFQVEYANKAVENSGTVIGLQCADGAILCVENIILSRMMLPTSNRFIYNIDEHLGLAIAGNVPDGRQLAGRARDEADNYKSQYGTPMPPYILADRMSQFMHFYTLHGGARPFGASAVIIGYDEGKEGYELFAVEPSGTCYKYYGTAVGKGKQGAKTEIEKLKLMELPVSEAKKEVTKILRKLFDESKDKQYRVEMSVISHETNNVHTHVSADEIASCEEWAMAKIEEEEDMEED